MNTKTLMIASALAMGLTGILLSFLPDEVLQLLDADTAQPLPLIVQLLGALYFSFAILNWTAKANLIGGIYSRPVAMGNFTHFAVGALALVKGTTGNQGVLLWGVVVVYTMFAASFGYVVFTHPLSKSQ